MPQITTLAALDALYGPPVPAALTKVSDHLTPLYRQWIGAARFVVLSTVGPGGTHGSPRGDDGPVVEIADGRTLLLPDWRGNNRLDCLRDIVADGRISLMFLVPGADNVVRVNGQAVLVDDADMCARFDKAGKHPRTVIVVTLHEAYFQCAKALLRSGLWSADTPRPQVPSAGDFLREQIPAFDGASYDATYPDYARNRMW
ncbi:pyridoxamine 5'-phosphate oxidase family protein [Jannaschia sp. M317]|uniref:pyridoxamine 5'-phosphate oxidase family protein n=1 Tax=Jannaschia sp. M317 TaxID=2867011 RepID=UPI0021A8EFBC|nr:pyridoxamine 5'-phosphate oxidase family protein [Jannaschia sp. M317]UWQ18407.1 pyridoxamine 5'-phosphate oxidase family protein [Jannaschia sp. M317]